MSLRNSTTAEIFDLAQKGKRQAVGRLLSMTERGGTAADEVAGFTHPLAGKAHIIGITGAPGAGKSTMVSSLVGHIIEQGQRPAVLAVDPSSPLTGGAILGDRVRMAAVDADPSSGAFIRSIATRGHAGGLALSIPGCVRVFDAVGYNPVIIETVGVGQVEVDVTAAADTTVVVVTPGMGDAVQANKAGLLEVADIFVVNKADQPGASDTRRDLELMLELSHVTGQEDADYRPPILMTNSLDGDGVTAVHEAITAHRHHLESSNTLVVRRLRRARFEILNRVQSSFERRLDAALETESSAEMLREVSAGALSPTDAAALVTTELLGTTD